MLDVYEHAYCTVFPTRNAYVQEFLKFVRWESVNKRLNAANELYEKIIKAGK
ncbi:Fe-Mn family superoxide dismutase [Pelotomaculum propionicicum]|uniref:Fe-Mn family superoxide dismutase n=1 Tax=Pelotomaculum propionicicum TaxID=258475 RepID=UPI003CFDB63D